MLDSLLIDCCDSVEQTTRQILLPMPPRAPRTQIAPWRHRVEQDPYDGEAWQALIAELAALPSSPDLLLERRALYDEFLTHFPTAVSFEDPSAPEPAPSGSYSCQSDPTVPYVHDAVAYPAYRVSSPPAVLTATRGASRNTCNFVGMALASVRGDGDERRQPVRRESHLQPLPAELPVREPLALIPHLHQDGAPAAGL